MSISPFCWLSHKKNSEPVGEAARAEVAKLPVGGPYEMPKNLDVSNSDNEAPAKKREDCLLNRHHSHLCCSKLTFVFRRYEVLTKQKTMPCRSAPAAPFLVRRTADEHQRSRLTGRQAMASSCVKSAAVQSASVGRCILPGYSRNYARIARGRHL